MDEETKMNYEQNKDRIDKQFYIDRRGKIHKYKGDMYEEVISMHYEIAFGLHPKMEHPEDFVMNLGWVLIGSSCYQTPIIKKTPSQSQINIMFDLELYDRLCILEYGRYVNYKEMSAKA